jgi:hypothetical protein
MCKVALLSIAVMMALVPQAVAAGKKGAAASQCEGGIQACIERCAARGGQARLCPKYCQTQRGC